MTKLLEEYQWKITKSWKRIKTKKLYNMNIYIKKWEDNIKKWFNHEKKNPEFKMNPDLLSKLSSTPIILSKLRNIH